MNAEQDNKGFDRIDIQCEIQPVPFDQLSQGAPGESSAAIRERVVAARAIQAERFKDAPASTASPKCPARCCASTVPSTAPPGFCPRHPVIGRAHSMSIKKRKTRYGFSFINKELS